MSMRGVVFLAGVFLAAVAIPTMFISEKGGVVLLVISVILMSIPVVLVLRELGPFVRSDKKY